jgi:pilus assembly protein CpaE
VPASTILVLDTDPAAGEVIQGVLTSVGYSVTLVSDSDEAFRQASDHHLVILDVISGPKTAIDVCREIRGTAALRSLPVLCIGQTDEVDERIRFLEGGADDVMARPFDARELEARVEALLLRFQRSKDLAPVVGSDGVTMPPRDNRIAAVFSPKGGVGTTTIATNIAMSLAIRRPDRAILIDLDLQFGQSATHLNLEPRQTLADVVREEAALREPELLRTYAIRHDSGLHLLASPPSPELSELIEPAHVHLLLETVLGSYDSVVVDGGSTLDERTMAVFEHADIVIIPVYPEIAALKAVHGLLDYLAEAGSVGAKTIFVLNNAFAREILKLRDVESALGTKIGAELPYDPFVYLKAVNEGVPVVVGAPRSAPAERLNRLATFAFATDGTAAAAIPAAKKKGGLGALLRR